MFSRLNNTMIKRRIGQEAVDLYIFWNEKAFYLDQVSFFNQLPLEVKSQLLKGLSLEIIEEAMHIERTAMDFASLMSLNCESEEQRESYALMNSDEIEHFYLLKRFIEGELPAAENNQFLIILKEVMDTESPAIMTFFGQVLLEGLSINYYKNLIPSCENDELRKTIKRIYLDEASHHSIGVSTLEVDKGVSAKEKNQLFDFIAAYIKLQHTLFPRIIEGISESLGGLSGAEKEKAFHEMKAPLLLQDSLDRIRYLLRFDLSSGFVEKLESKKLLTAPKVYVGV